MSPEFEDFLKAIDKLDLEIDAPTMFSILERRVMNTLLLAAAEKNNKVMRSCGEPVRRKA